MRRLPLAAVLFTAFAFVGSNAAAFVEPPAGSVLPDFDVRHHGTATGPVGLEQEVGSSTRRPLITVEPMARQETWLRVMRSRWSSRVRAEYQSTNGLPRFLHAYGAPLSAPSQLDPVTICREFLRTNQQLFVLSDAEIANLVVGRNANTDGAFHTVWLAQMHDGILVDKSAIRFNLDPQGRVVWMSVGLGVTPQLSVPSTATLAPDQAVIAAAGHIGVDLYDPLPLKSTVGDRILTYERGPFLGDVTVEPTIFPMAGGGAILGWRVTMEPAGGTPAWYVVTVDGRAGRLLQRLNLYDYATNAGWVFHGNYPAQVDPDYPNGVGQTEQSFGYRWQSTRGYTIRAPYGQYRFTVGNNVEAREDRRGDNEGTLGVQPDGGVNQEWFFPFTNAYALSTGTTDAARIAAGLADIDSVITNLFYWNNVWHDRMYELGFTETYGNFQFDNMSRGACGSDAVRADAQDGAELTPPSLNNANFGTPPEPIDCAGAFRPRMQQFMTRAGTEAAPVWLGDTSLDADVIIHEFSHGTSHRLVGGFEFGCLGLDQSGGMGEGWGDWYAASHFDDPVMGEYSFADPVAGVRCWNMRDNPLGFADVCGATPCQAGGCQVHKEGEIWAATLWDMRELVGKEVADHLVTDGMKFSVCNPGFLDMRDAILLADEARYAGAHQCDIWRAFTGRGMGFFATSDGSANNVPDEQFIDPQCDGIGVLRYNTHWVVESEVGNGDGLFGIGEIFNLAVEIQNFDGAGPATDIDATVTALSSGITMTVPTVDYRDLWPPAAGSNPDPFKFRIDPDYVCGQGLEFEIELRWAPGLSRRDRFRLKPSDGSIPGPVFVASDAEGVPIATTGPFQVSNAYNHTPGGANSYYTLGGCFTVEEPGCDFVSPCNNTCGTIPFGTVTLPTNRTAKLGFWATYNVEYNWDGLYVRASRDGGATWDLVDTIAYPATIPAQANGCFPAVDVAGINGPGDNQSLVPWSYFAGDLAAYSGQTIQLELVNHQDGCVVFEGAYVDDIALALQHCTTDPFGELFVGSRVNVDTANGACTDNDGVPDPGETIDVTLEAVNSGNTVVSNVMGTLVTTNPNITMVVANGNYGTLNPGQSATQTFRYTVANTAVPCFSTADFELQLSGNGGAVTHNAPFSETLRADAAIGVWFDDFDGAQLPWTGSIGPDGSINDFLIRRLNCTTNGDFWSTNIGMVATVCGSGEPDYSPDSDSVITSPMIDLGAPGMRLLNLSWGSLTPTFPTLVPAGTGFSEVLIDHDGDSVFTSLWKADGGFGAPDATSTRFEVDVQNNPGGNPIDPGVTSQFVQLQFRFRSELADPGGSADSVGMVVNDLVLDWQRCDVNLCTPGVTSTTVGGVGLGTSTTPPRTLPTGPGINGRR